MYKIFTNWLGSMVIKNTDTEVYCIPMPVLETKTYKLEKVTESDMQKMLDKYKHVNVMNRPSVLFIYEYLLKKKTVHTDVNINQFYHVSDIGIKGITEDF